LAGRKKITKRLRSTTERGEKGLPHSKREDDCHRRKEEKRKNKIKEKEFFHHNSEPKELSRGRKGNAKRAKQNPI